MSSCPVRSSIIPISGHGSTSAARLKAGSSGRPALSWSSGAPMTDLPISRFWRSPPAATGRPCCDRGLRHRMPTSRPQRSQAVLGCRRRIQLRRRRAVMVYRAAQRGAWPLQQGFHDEDRGRLCQSEGIRTAYQPPRLMEGAYLRLSGLRLVALPGLICFPACPPSRFPLRHSTTHRRAVRRSLNVT